MDMQLLQQVLGWCLALNYLILLIWFLVFIYARTWMKSLHGRWFNLNDQTFDAIHYAAMAVYKILIMVFNLVPFIVLSLLS
ncbi:DUF6868 family protein [Acinetobacter sp. ANC 4173]|uniref:DUF6868 family protein n=1 Tax=Acinetobacter sp. ANC 4173 TaxID=2529837 RepID=UPI00103DE86B|nr:hypothetical protein [Acinetobacter sp. ANC 4173]TCB78501.1 hypothetical protein E0H94_12415 [Acinetobacter sp. ANC 4173]